MPHNYEKRENVTVCVHIEVYFDHRIAQQEAIRKCYISFDIFPIPQFFSVQAGFHIAVSCRKVPVTAVCLLLSAISPVHKLLEIS